MELLKIIREVSKPGYKGEYHRPNWVLEVHRLHFFMPSDCSVFHSIKLKDGTSATRAVIDGVVPVKPPLTMALNPKNMGAGDPIRIVVPAVADAAAVDAAAAASAALAAAAAAM